MRRVLFISHRLPYPPDKGERIRAFHEIRALAREYRVTAAALVQSSSQRQAAAGLKRLCEQIILAGVGGRTGLLRGALSMAAGRSVTEGFFQSGSLRRALLAAAEREPFDLAIAYSSSVVPTALQVPARAYLADLVDADSAKWTEYADASPWPASWLYRREANAVRALEEMAVRRCDAVTVVSRAEAVHLSLQNEKVSVLPNGVDLNYFAPAEGRDLTRPCLVFTGTMNYRPNVEGICWFARNVWPGLKKAVPDLRLFIVGRDPTRQVRSLSKHPGVAVTGSVKDVRPYLSAATVAIAPLLMARGIQNKVLEAMAMGRAVVASPAALEGLDVSVGEEVMLADSAEQWHRQLTGLIFDDSARRRIERAARKCVADNYRWETAMEPLLSLCGGILDRAHAAPVKPEAAELPSEHGKPQAECPQQ